VDQGRQEEIDRLDRLASALVELPQSDIERLRIRSAYFPHVKHVIRDLAGRERTSDCAEMILSLAVFACLDLLTSGEKLHDDSARKERKAANERLEKAARGVQEQKDDILYLARSLRPVLGPPANGSRLICSGPVRVSGRISRVRRNHRAMCSRSRSLNCRRMSCPMPVGCAQRFQGSAANA
jgi:hypothetical protein